MIKLIRAFLTGLRLLFSFTWYNTEVEVNLEEDIQNYKDKPYVKVMDQYGETVAEGHDSKIRYDVMDTHLQISEVNTRVTGTYSVCYRATYNGQNEIFSDKIVKFKVVDKIKPQVQLIKPLNFYVGEPKTLKEILKEHFMPSDNYSYYRVAIADGSSLPPVTNYQTVALYENLYGLPQLSFSKVGTYKLTYSLCDGANNYITKTYNAVVTDNTPPTITKKKPLFLYPGTVFNIKKFFTFADNVDATVTDITFEIEGDLSQTGLHQLKIIAKDSSNNVATFNDVIKVGAYPPEIITINQIILPVFDEEVDKHIREAIIRVEYYDDTYGVDDVIYSSDVVSTHIGEYDVTFSLKDKNSGSVISTKTIPIEVKDLEAPTIRSSEENQRLCVEVFTPSIDLMSYFTFKDNYYSVDQLTISDIKQSSYDLNKIGAYMFKVEAKDPSGNIRTKTYYIYVVDKVAPEFEIIKELRTPLSEELDIKSCFNFSDNYYKKNSLAVAFTIEENYYYTLGSHKLVVEVKDPSNNILKKDVNIEVYDDIPPVIILKQDVFHYFIGDEKPNLKENIKDVIDNHTETKQLKHFIESDIDYSKVGMYEVLYYTYDTSNNIGCSKLTFYVDDNNIPEIKLNPLVVDRKETKKRINLLAGISSDVQEKYSIKVLTEVPQNLKSGQYLIKYRAKNSRGYSKEFTRILIVNEKTKAKNILISLVVVSAIFLIASVTATVVLKKKNKKSNMKL